MLLNHKVSINNQTTVPYFLLMEFSKIRHLQILHFFLFFVFYLATATANLLIIAAVAFDQRLQTPMYLFLMNLAMQDFGYISVIVSKSMVNSLMDTRHISYFGCVAQVFFLITFFGSDVSLLTVMAYDRYVAICMPLQYEMVMNWKDCIDIVIIVWVTSLLYGMLHTVCTFSVPFCSNVVNQFFCEIPQLLKLSCSGFNVAELGVILVGGIAGFGCFTFITVSYIMIFKSVWRIPSVQGRQKALSTCVPHLIVVSLLFVTGAFAYLRHPSNTSSYLDLALTLLYSFLPPMCNPIIYSMRNKDLKLVLSQMWRF